MVRQLTLLFLGTFFIAGARAELLLTPKVVRYEADGVKSELLAFADNAKTVTYRPPHGWGYSGEAARLTLRPPQTTQAEATVTKSSLKKRTPLDEETIRTLVTEALRSAPAGSTDVTITSQEKNALFIGGKETFRITLSYTFYGEIFARYLVFLNRESEQIRFQLVCRVADSKKLQQEFQASLCNWRNL
jgi:hypothetical protein